MSQNGLLEVTFHFRTTVDAQGLTRYCYVTDTGLESPTLVVSPGDQLTLHFENDISGTAASASARQMPGMVMHRASAAAREIAMLRPWTQPAPISISMASMPLHVPPG